jgi:hypothetical protein
VDHDKFSEVHARGLLDIPSTISQRKYRLGMHSIWGRCGLLAITLSNSKYSVFIRMSNAEARNIAFRRLIEDPNVHIIGFHPERVAIALYSRFRYQMEAFYEINTTNPPRRSIEDVYFRYILGHEGKPSFDNVKFLSDPEWITVKENSDIQKVHVTEGTICAHMACHVGELLIKHKILQMNWALLQNRSPHIIGFWIQMAKDANASTSLAKPGFEIDHEALSLQVFFISLFPLSAIR